MENDIWLQLAQRLDGAPVAQVAATLQRVFCDGLAGVVPVANEADTQDL